MKLAAAPRWILFDVALLQLVLHFRTPTVSCLPHAPASVDVEADLKCPAGSSCVHALRCTMMMDPADLTLAADWRMPNPDRIYHRCRISGRFEGICCQTGKWNNYRDDKNDAQLNGTAATRTASGGVSEEYLRFLRQRSNDIDHGHKVHKRAVSDYEQLFGSDVSLQKDSDTIARTKRCIVGPECNEKRLRYRTFDGHCNNVRPGKSLWGSAGYPMERILPPAYDDGVWSPRTFSTTGKCLPSARKISIEMFADLHIPHKKYNVLMMQFGQFLVHDITKNKGISSEIKCCKENGTQALPNAPSACFPITVPKKDPFYSQFGVNCLEFIRTAIAPKQDCHADHGRQISAVTHFIDGSGIYGSSLNEVNELRARQGGRLKSLNHRRVNNELPILEKDPTACDKKAKMCFKVGDDRVNQIVTLVATHTLFLREHNRIAVILQQLNPHWSDEVVFQETRRIVGAELQHIVYNEYLPKIVGPHFMEKYELFTSRGYSDFYNPHVNPSITSEFSSAAFRFGHSTVPGQLEYPKGVVETHKTFFDPTPMRDPGFFDGIFHGILVQPMQKVDDLFTDSLTTFLNPKEGQQFGKDLAAINIQRGRDHAVRPYNHYLQLGGRAVKTNFKEFGQVVGTKLAQLYVTPDDVDLYVGGILEHPVENGTVGETFAEIISDQFARLKEGDRYFYSNGPRSNPGHFTLPQLEELQKMTLAGVLCANANNKHTFEVQPDAFALPHLKWNPMLPCRASEIPKLDLGWWKD